ncbi:hypothetical protein PTSG_01565 [Salpingoeca rosetta]|uniref:OPA3-like protein n=1 Tax=Salpingoeca rosetta (strain ATCC 50818 / BSB-021) TaxID=946362 RepID=F2U0Q5_SALR5|nr:uncharacterized protein PTSG_01565 [Salpingoeca rosetta]EGD80983.1 hypothetical protein PTSG_01565 [Salpingoeca rosetta]|eukprot:XP_004997544.1 hypothetical protein PTSG_01565 [Salpingoeca rosetta]
MSALPIMKIMSLTIKTVAKPISKLLKQQAMTHETLRQRVVVPVGQATHWISVRLQRLTMNSSRRDVKPLSEDLAVTYGAEFIGEFFIFSVATVMLVGEYNASAKKSAAKEAKLQSTLASLRDDIEQLRAQQADTQEQLRTVLAQLQQQQQQQRGANPHNTAAVDATAAAAAAAAQSPSAKTTSQAGFFNFWPFG